MATAIDFNARREPAAGWSPPDMSILSAGRSAAAPMPPEMLGTLWPLACDLADGAGAPVDYVAFGIIGVAASLIGARYRVQPFVTTPQWREPCILWPVAVGDPSSRKSPAIDAATAPLRQMEAEHAEVHRSYLMAYEAQLERANAERQRWKEDVKIAMKAGEATPPMPQAAVLPDEPARRRLLVQDATPEAVAEILAGNPNGTLHLRDELAGWLLSFERYSPGGREFWLEAFGGRPFTVDRKSLKAPLKITFNGVTVLGGIQPEKLRDCLLKVADDGLVPRFLWAWPDPVPYQRPRQAADVMKLERVYRRLDGMRGNPEESGQPTVLLLDDDAGDVYAAWQQANCENVRDAASLYKGFCGKLDGVVLRLALVAELLAWAAGTGAEEPRSVSVEAVLAAVTLVEDYAKPTALRVFGDAGLPPAERHAAMLARYVQRTKADRINLREVKRGSGIPDLKEGAAMEDATEALVDAGWLRAASRDHSPGRPAKDYLVNPAVHLEAA